ncbi:MAG: NADH-quinone oxidoreductase subunit A [Planctomycetota bacterium]
MSVLLLSLTIFLAIGFAFVLASLIAGALIRPRVPSAMKQSIYECGEEVEELEAAQFDLRFYVVALFFLIFDVEVALLWPVAVIFREQAEVLLAIAGVFMLLIVAGFAYEWYSGSLDWIRSTGAGLRNAPPRPIQSGGMIRGMQPVPAAGAASAGFSPSTERAAATSAGGGLDGAQARPTATFRGDNGRGATSGSAASGGAAGTSEGRRVGEPAEVRDPTPEST